MKGVSCFNGGVVFRWGGASFVIGVPHGGINFGGGGFKKYRKMGDPQCPPHYGKPCFIVIGKIVG